jgi:DNA-binding CsgD family transcriptional regulator/tetratricopeptide (TPR) repeat protein
MLFSLIRSLTTLLLISSSLYGQITTTPSIPQKLEIADTATAAKRLNKWLQEAIHIDATGVNDPVLRNQLGFALMPFAGQSPAAIAAMYNQYSSQLTENQLIALSLEGYKAEIRRRYSAKEYQPSVSSWEILNNIASYYLTSNQYDSALLYYKKALAETEALRQPILRSSSFNNIGFFLMSTERKHEEAEEYFTNAESLLSNSTRNDSTLRGSITDNRAQLAVKERKWDLANELYNRNVQLYGLLQIPTKVFQAHCGLLNLALLQNRPTYANASFKSLEALLDTSRQQIEPANIYHYFSLAQQYFKSIGKTDAALIIANKSERYRDSLNKEEKKYLSGKLQEVARSQSFKSVYEETLYQHNLAITRSNARKSLLITILGSVLTVSLLIFIILQFRSRHKIQKGEIERRSIAQQLAEANAEKELLEREKIQTELMYSKKDLSDFAQYLHQQRDSYSEMVGRLAIIKQKTEGLQAKDLHRLAIDTAAKVQVQEKTTIIQNKVEKINTAFAQKLLEKYPHLTKGEVQLCGFIRLNMSNKEIGLAKNVNPDSVKRDRNRLRSKLGLQPAEDLAKFLSEW